MCVEFEKNDERMQDWLLKTRKDARKKGSIWQQ